MTLFNPSQDIFLAKLKSVFFEKNIKEDVLWQKNKAKAWEKFSAIGLPTKKSEHYQYIHLRSLFDSEFSMGTQDAHLDNISKYVLPECEHSFLVFVNGKYNAQLSNRVALPEKMVILSFKEALKTYGTLISNQYTKSIGEESDSFAALNAAMHEDGLFVYIPPKTIVERPIQILNVVDSHSNNLFLFPRIQSFVGAHAQVSFVSTPTFISNACHCFNQAMEMTIEEGAQVNYYQMQLNIPAETWHFDAFRASLKKNARLKIASAASGSVMSRCDYRIQLTGENAEASLNGITLLSDNREAHQHILMDHQAPHCRSMQLYKSVLNDFSRSSFEGKILVRKPAQKTEAFQLNNNLLLNDRAQSNSKPNLEIFADDVKASHGATIGQLDAEQLFYMKSRGFAEHDAKNLLVFSFCQEVIDLFTISSIQQEVTHWAKSYLLKDSYALSKR